MGAEVSSLEEKLKITYEQLRGKNPKHELLTLVQINPETGYFNFSKSYYERFVDFRDEFGTLGLFKYHTALEKALKE